MNNINTKSGISDFNNFKMRQQMIDFFQMLLSVLYALL